MDILFIKHYETILTHRLLLFGKVDIIFTALINHGIIFGMHVVNNKQ